MKRALDFTIQFHITDKCPNRCIHCYSERGYAEIDINKIRGIFDNVKKFEEKYQVLIPNVNVTGGAPLCRPDWSEIISLIRSYRKNITIMGIPEHVDLNNIVQMKRLGINAYQMSLDGMEKTHDNFRGKGSFQKTLKAIRLLNKHNLKVLIMYTVSDINYKELLPLIDFLEHEQVHVVFAFDFVVSKGNAQENGVSISNQRKWEILHTYYDKYKENTKGHSSVELVLKPSLFMPMVYQNMPKILLDEYSHVAGCGLGWNTITVMPDGTVFPCRRLPISIGNICRDSFEGILLENEFMRKLRRYENFLQCNECQQQLFCRGCPAINNGVYGDPFANCEPCALYRANKQNTDRVETINHSNEDEYKLIANTMENKVLRYFSTPAMDYFIALKLLKESEESRKLFYKDRLMWLSNNELWIPLYMVDYLTLTFINSTSFI